MEKRTKKPAKKTTIQKKTKTQKEKIKAKTKQIAKEREKKRVYGKKLMRDTTSIKPGQKEPTLTLSREGLTFAAEEHFSRGFAVTETPTRHRDTHPSQRHPH